MRTLCEKCHYKTADSELIDIILRDQFLVGIINADLQLKILEVNNSKLTFDETVYFAKEKFLQITANRIESKNISGQ